VLCCQRGGGGRYTICRKGATNCGAKGEGSAQPKPAGFSAKTKEHNPHIFFSFHRQLEKVICDDQKNQGLLVEAAGGPPAWDITGRQFCHIVSGHLIIIIYEYLEAYIPSL